MFIQQILSKLNPKRLFLIDGLGALLTAIIIGFVLSRFENTIGIPLRLLYSLSFIAGIFSIYSLICFLRNSGNWKLYMKIIAVLNLVYCSLTLGLIIFLYPEINVWGLVYFVLEIFVITILAVIELKTVSV